MQFKFEAMDAKGAEIKDTITADSEEEAQEMVRRMGYFVTKMTRVVTLQRDSESVENEVKKKSVARLIDPSLVGTIAICVLVVLGLAFAIIGRDQRSSVTVFAPESVSSEFKCPNCGKSFKLVE